MIILDTNTISEMMKPLPSPKMMAWVSHCIADLAMQYGNQTSETFIYPQTKNTAPPVDSKMIILLHYRPLQWFQQQVSVHWVRSHFLDEKFRRGMM